MNRVQFIAASSIYLDTTLVYSSGTDVKSALVGLDGQIGMMMDGNTKVGEGMTTIQNDLTTEISNREDGDTSLKADLDAHTGATAAHGSDGNVVGQNTLDAHVNATSAHGSSGAVVGQTTLDTHTSATAAHGSDGNVVGQNTLDAHISDTSTHGVSGSIVGTSDSQTLSNKTLDNTNNITGDAITSGTVDKAWIDDEIARDSELPTVVTDHGDLTGRGDDDHAQYLLASGVRAMSGNLVMDDTTCNTNSGHNCYVDGVDVSAIGDVFPDTSGDSDTDGDGDVDLDDRYVDVDGDVMSGTLDMNSNSISSVNNLDVNGTANVYYNSTDWDVGYTLDNHEARLDALDWGNETTGITAFAYGTMDGSGVLNSHGMNPSVTPNGSNGICSASGIIGNRSYTLAFAEARTNDNYVVNITPIQSSGLIMGSAIIAKSNTGFTVRLFTFSGGSTNCMLATSGAFDFVVFAP